MTHPIYVCLECKITMHTCRNVGTHCKTHHKIWYGRAEKEGIVVKIGDCDPKAHMLGVCPSKRDRPATKTELMIAQQLQLRRRKE